MAISTIIDDAILKLKEERDRIDQAIAALSVLQGDPVPAQAPTEVQNTATRGRRGARSASNDKIRTSPCRADILKVLRDKDNPLKILSLTQAEILTDLLPRCNVKTFPSMLKSVLTAMVGSGSVAVDNSGPEMKYTLYAEPVDERE